MYEVHLVIRGALTDAVRRGVLARNVALVAHAPRLGSIAKVEQRAWAADELQTFLRAAGGHRLFPALIVPGVLPAIEPTVEGREKRRTKTA